MEPNTPSIEDLAREIALLKQSGQAKLLHQSMIPNGTIKKRAIQQGDVLKLNDQTQDYSAYFGTTTASLSTAITASASVTFTNAFPTACVAVYLTVQAAPTNGVSKYVAGAKSISKTGFSLDVSYWVNTNTTETVTVGWLAIGY